MYTKSKEVTKKLYYIVLGILFSTLILVSCSSDEEGTSVADNTCYISKVSFSTMKRLVFCKASDGVTDSSFYTSFSASKWIFAIDQKANFIENRDSLPCNTDLSKVVMDLSYVAATAYYRSSSAWEEDPWVPFQATDSIDLRLPLHIRLVASDNTERMYTMQLNVHTVEGESLQWTTVDAPESVKGDYPMKALEWKNNVAVMTSDGSAVLWVACPNDNAGEWRTSVTNLPSDTDVSSLTMGQDAVYVNTESGVLYSSCDGETWTEMCSQEGLRLAGAYGNTVYAIFNGGISRTVDDNINWKLESIDVDGMDGNGSLLPQKDIVSLVYRPSSNLTRMLLLGNREVETDANVVAWSKSWTVFEDKDLEQWVHYTRSLDNIRQLPQLSQMNVVHYDNMLMLAAGKSYDGSVKALESFYVSKDNGLTWCSLKDILPPSDLKGVEGNIAFMADSDDYLWIFGGGKVYRGRLNRLGFDRSDLF